MPIIDFHCDTIYEIYHSARAIELYKNDLKVDIEKLKKSDVMAQVFALFIDQEKIKNQNQSPIEYAYAMKETYKNQINKYNSDIIFANNYNDIIDNRNSNKISALLSVEGGEVLEGNINNLYKIYNWNVRILTLTWNYNNELGFSHNNAGGLTNFGKDVVQYMNELGILIDVSHLSDDGFWDVISISNQPIIASHSNSRTLCDHSRNLTDEMIKAIANQGGVIGINLYGKFLNKNGYSTIDSIVQHIQHIYQVGGIESIALGGDFDGFTGQLEVYNAGEWARLIDRLKKKNIRNGHIEKITYQNALRIIKDVL